jgi:sec-independent protein translocase protein TatA
LGGLQPWHWVIVIAVFVLLFGAKKLPDAARSLGKSMRIFKSEIKEMQSESKPEAPLQPPEVVGRPAPSATPIASERVETPDPRPDVAGQAAPSSEPTDKRPA